MNRRGEGRSSNVTYLIDHHHSQEITGRCEKQAVEIVLHLLADALGERVEDDLADDEDKNAEANVTERPPVLQGIRH